MNFTSVDIHLFANYMSASSFRSCLHTEDTAHISGGLFNIYTITVGKLTFLKSVALHENTTKIKDVCKIFMFTKQFLSALSLVWDSVPFPFQKNQDKTKQKKTQHQSLMFKW